MTIQSSHDAFEDDNKIEHNDDNTKFDDNDNTDDHRIRLRVRVRLRVRDNNVRVGFRVNG